MLLTILLDGSPLPSIHDADDDDDDDDDDDYDDDDDDDGDVHDDDDDDDDDDHDDHDDDNDDDYWNSWKISLRSFWWSGNQNYTIHHRGSRLPGASHTELPLQQTVQTELSFSGDN
eukprot:1317268-Amphidinium_carterae.1